MMKIGSLSLLMLGLASHLVSGKKETIRQSVNSNKTIHSALLHRVYIYSGLNNLFFSASLPYEDYIYPPPAARQNVLSNTSSNFF